MGAMHALVTQVAHKNLAVQATFGAYAITGDRYYKVQVSLGDGANPLNGTPGEYVVKISYDTGGLGSEYFFITQTIAITLSSSCLVLETPELYVPLLGENLRVYITSPNVTDVNVHTSVDVLLTRGDLPGIAPNAVGGLLTRGTGAGQINPDGTGQVPSSNAALAASYTAGRAALLDNLDAAVSVAVAAAATALTAYDPPTNAELTAVQAALTVLIDALNDLSVAATAAAILDAASAAHLGAGTIGAKIASSGAHIDVGFRNISVRGD